ncbi:MAG: TPM domain-containing protein [Treponema sp.]|nr:TPM domain-containing protein [Treponema sp.]
MKKILSSVFAAAFMLFAPLYAQEDTIYFDMDAEGYDVDESIDDAFDQFIYNDSTDFFAVIEDAADILTVEEEKKLIDYMSPITQWGDVAYYTFNENYGAPVKELAETYYQMMLAEEGSGTAFLVDVYNGDFYIFNGGAIGSVVDDELLMSQVSDAASKGEYFKSASTAFDLMYYSISDTGLSVEPVKDFTVTTGTEYQTLTYTNNETRYTAIVRDGANIMSDEEEKKLLDDIKALTQWGNAIVYTTYEGSGSSAEDFAATVYEDTFAPGENGAIFLIDMDRRWLQIHTDGSVNKIVTPNYCQSITDNVYKMATIGDYYSCVSEAFKQMTTLLEGGKISQPMKHASNALFAIIIAMIICYIYMKSNGKTESERYQKPASPVFNGSLNNLTVTKGRLTSVTHSSSSGGGSRGGGGGHSGGGGGHGF